MLQIICFKLKKKHFYVFRKAGFSKSHAYSESYYAGDCYSDVIWVFLEVGEGLIKPQKSKSS